MENENVVLGKGRQHYEFKLWPLPTYVLSQKGPLNIFSMDG